MRRLILFYSLCFFMILSYGLLAARAEESKSTTILRGEIYYGQASWYGRKFHGRKTSNGERFNKNKLTAAHKSIPFDTLVEVTNLKNQRSVVVRINDRGPFKKGRIIDLSEKAAKVIGSRNDGIAYVKVRVIRNGKKIARRAPDKKLISLK